MNKIASSLNYKKATGLGSIPGGWNRLQKEKWNNFCRDAASSIVTCLSGPNPEECLPSAIAKNNPADYVGPVSSITKVNAGKLRVKIEVALDNAGFESHESSYYGDFLKVEILKKFSIKVKKD